MPADGSTSYNGVVAEQDAKIHAGHNYNNVTNNYPTQPTISTELPFPHSKAFRRIKLAPTGDSVHQDFVEAAKHGQGTIRLEYLLSRGANVDIRDKTGLTPLYHAAFQGDSENVQFLADHGADVNSGHPLLGTPIAVAALRGHSRVVETLLKHKVDILRVLPGLGSALHCACFGGNIGIFKLILHNASLDESYDYLASYRVVHLKAFSVVSATSLESPALRRLLANQQDFKDLIIRCSPIFLAAERCHFDILHLCRSEFHHDYFSLSLWDFPDREEKTVHNERVQRRIKASWTSVESRSGPSYASKGSLSSAWSTLGFPLAAWEHPRSTLLMWAAASLNLPLINHLLGVGASATTMDEFGQTALHYAATPLLDAKFKNVKECVRLLLADQASVSTKPSIQIAKRPPPLGSIKSPLELVVGSDHAALDPRTSYRWGSDVHRTCISAFLDPLPSKNERSQSAQEALLYALSNKTCPADSIKLLCKYTVDSGPDSDPLLTSCVLDEALHYALRNSAAEPIILALLDHGANPNAETYKLPLITAISSETSEAVVTALLQHGANPNLRPKSGPPMTPLECAKQCDRQDMIAFINRHDTVSRLPDLSPSRSAGPSFAEASLRRIQSSRSPASLTLLGGLNDVDEVAELDDMGEDSMDKLKAQSTNDSQDSVGPSRPWFPGIPLFPLARFRRNSKQK